MSVKLVFGDSLAAIKLIDAAENFRVDAVAIFQKPAILLFSGVEQENKKGGAKKKAGHMARHFAASHVVNAAFNTMCFVCLRLDDRYDETESVQISE